MIPEARLATQTDASGGQGSRLHEVRHGEFDRAHLAALQALPVPFQGMKTWSLPWGVAWRRWALLGSLLAVGLAGVGCSNPSLPSQERTDARQADAGVQRPREVRPEDLPQGVFIPLMPLGNGSTLGLDTRPRERDSLDLRGECLSRINRCISSHQDRAPEERRESVQSTWVDDCVATVPKCATGDWRRERDCCPTACAAAYSRIRSERQTADQAYEAAFLHTDECYPGHEQWSR